MAARKKTSRAKPASVPRKRSASKPKAKTKKARTAKVITSPTITHALSRSLTEEPLPKASTVERPSNGSNAKRSLLPWLIAAGFGFLFFSSKRSAGATLPPLPKPAVPPATFPLLELPAGAASPPPLAPPNSTHPNTAGGASWSPDGKTLNSLSGYHRAKSAEVSSDIVAAATSALSGHDIGQIVYGTTPTGVSYAIALEQHYHPPGGAEKPWGPHKGSSVFVAN